MPGVPDMPEVTQQQIADQNKKDDKKTLPPEQSFDDAWDSMVDKKTTNAASPPTDNTGETASTPAAETNATDDTAEGEQTEQAAAPAPAEDLWAGLNDKQKQALNDLNNRLATTEHQARTDAGRVSAFQKKLDEVLKSQQNRTAQPTAAEVQQAMQTPEGWAQLEQDYPTIAGPIKAALKAAEDRITKQVTEVVTSRVNPLLEARQQDEEERERTYVSEQVRMLSEAHPDWQTVKATPEFKQWLSEQSPMVQAGIKSRNAADAIQILSLYKGPAESDTAGDLTQRRQRRLQQAATTQGVSGRAATSRPAEIPDEFGAAWDALGRQRATGKK